MERTPPLAVGVGVWPYHPRMTGWTNIEDWLVAVERERGPEELAVARLVVAWCEDRELKHRGQGNDQDNKGVIYTPVIPGVDWDPVPFHVTSKTGSVGLEGKNVGGQGRHPYGNPDSFARLIAKLHAIPGVAQHKDTYPDIPLADLADPERFAQFFGLMDQVVRGIRRANT